MREFLIETQFLWMLLIGWLLGILTGPIQERIRRSYREQDLVKAILNEFRGLQYTMALVAMQIRTRRADSSDGFLDSIIPIVANYDGPDKDANLLGALTSLRSRSASERNEARPPIGSPLVLKRYSVPIFSTHVSDLAVCDLDFQTAVLTIRHHLELLNESLPHIEKMFDMTVRETSAGSREHVLQILQNLEVDYGSRTEIIMNLITDLQNRFSRQRSR